LESSGFVIMLLLLSICSMLYQLTHFLLSCSMATGYPDSIACCHFPHPAFLALLDSTRALLRTLPAPAWCLLCTLPVACLALCLVLCSVFTPALCLPHLRSASPRTLPVACLALCPAFYLPSASPSACSPPRRILSRPPILAPSPRSLADPAPRLAPAPSQPAG